MRKHPRYLAQAAIIAALYVLLTHLQNILFPGSASWAIQLRLSEALCVLALFTPAAAPGLALGCLLFNLTSTAALPLDFLLGTLGSLLAGQSMWMTRNLRLGAYPLPALLMPALCNGVLVGLALTLYLGGGFVFHALWVAIGEGVVLLGPGSILYFAIKKRNLDRRLFAP